MKKVVSTSQWNRFAAITLIVAASTLLAIPSRAENRETTVVRETKFGTPDKVKTKAPGFKMKMKEGENGGEEKVKIKDREAKIKIKERKTKVKVLRGKAKFKANGKEKVKGSNGARAAAIALEEMAKEEARERAGGGFGSGFRSK